jgi:large subunit ribosomal protein L32e
MWILVALCCPGFLKFSVNNVQDLELLLMHNRKYCAEIAHTVSSLTRQQIVKRAAELNVRVLNKSAKLRTEESA